MRRRPLLFTVAGTVCAVPAVALFLIVGILALNVGATWPLLVVGVPLGAIGALFGLVALWFLSPPRGRRR